MSTTRVAAALIALALSFVSPSSAGTVGGPLDGHWSGTMTHEGVPLAIEFDFSTRGGKTAGSFTSRSQRVLEYPFDAVQLAAEHVQINLGHGSVTFTGDANADEMSGSFKDRELGTGTFALHRIPQPAVPYTSEAVTFRNGEVTLSGSLYVPVTPGKHPAIVFLQGSGPEIRWGANRFWADYFARRGVAALIYDKRGSGESTGDWKTSTFEDLANDAAAAIALLAARADIDARQIGIAGHSQGATIAPLIATKSPVAFVIAESASGIPLWQSEVYSLHNAVLDAGVRGAALAHADHVIGLLIAYARTGRGWDKLASAQAQYPKEGWHDVLATPKTSYFWSFFRQIADYDAATYWRKVRVPALIVEAGADRRVPIQPSIAAIRSALTAAGNSDGTILELPGASHTFIVHAQERPFHWSYLYPGVADLLVAWTRYHTAPH